MTVSALCPLCNIAVNHLLMSCAKRSAMQSYCHDGQAESRRGHSPAAARERPGAHPARARSAARYLVPAGAARPGGPRRDALLPPWASRARHVRSGDAGPRLRRGVQEILFHRHRLAGVHLLDGGPRPGLRRDRRFLCAQGPQARGGRPYPALCRGRDRRAHSRRCPLACAAQGLHQLSRSGRSAGRSRAEPAARHRPGAVRAGLGGTRLGPARLRGGLSGGGAAAGPLQHHQAAHRARRGGAQPWHSLPGLWLAGGVLLLGGGAFAVAERLRK